MRQVCRMIMRKKAVLLCLLSESHFSGKFIQSRCLKPSFFCHPMQPVREHGKTQSALAQDALVRGG
ncbi:hypothetical protein ACZ87_03339, partial [Candidatus Erwinia dacicola]